MQERKTYQCQRCGQTLRAQNFYTSKSEADAPTDYVVQTCKKCLSAHINVFEPSTLLPVLERLNYPYIPEEWENLVQRYVDPENPGGTTPHSILGRYLGKMKLTQYRDYDWASTTEIASTKAKKEALAQAQKEAYQLRYKNALGLGASADLAAIDRTLLTEDEIAVIFAPEGQRAQAEPKYADGAESMAELSVAQPATGPVGGARRGRLMPDDARMLAAKWGSLYSEEELLQMERLYYEMMASFEISTASHLDYLKKICKVSLKLEQGLDVNDIEGASKTARVYDNLMKSARFTAQQNKSESSAEEESLVRAILLAEQHGHIPMADVTVARDDIDFMLADFQAYTRRLVTEEQGLGNMIENAISQMARVEEEDAAEAEQADLLAPESYDQFDEVQAESDRYAHLEQDEDELFGGYLDE